MVDPAPVDAPDELLLVGPVNPSVPVSSLPQATIQAQMTTTEEQRATLRMGVSPFEYVHNVDDVFQTLQPMIAGVMDDCAKGSSYYE